MLNEFLNKNIIKIYSKHTAPRAVFAERVKRTIRDLVKKPVFEKGNADCLSEPPSVIKQYNNTIHHSIEMTPFQASKKSNEKKVFCNLKDKREIRKSKIKLVQLIRTADIKRVFSKGDSTIYSFKLYTNTEVINDTVPSYGNDYLPERHTEILVLPTNLTLDEYNKGIEDLKIFQ